MLLEPIKRELFTVTKQVDGKVSIVVNKIDKTGAISSKIYDRTFEPGVTQIVHLYGLSDEDRFVIAGGESPIKIRIIGGPGNDEFINNGSGGRCFCMMPVMRKIKLVATPD